VTRADRSGARHHRPGVGRSRGAALTLAIALLAQQTARADDDAAVTAKPAAVGPSGTRGLVELKRQATARGTPEETTKTNLKFDYFPQDTVVALLRLELPFPDEKTTFGGSPFDPDFGDAKVRVGFMAQNVLGRPTTSFLEVTFPTAHPGSQGTGKYQLSAGAKTAFAALRGPARFGSPRQVFSVQLQQVVSFAGDPARSDINQTKLELEWRDTWAAGHYAKGTAKPVVDWVGNGRTGAVLELEGGWTLDSRWTIALLGGGRLWGDGVPGTYSKRVELKLVHRYCPRRRREA
jgi:hypothetical protein